MRPSIWCRPRTTSWSPRTAWQSLRLSLAVGLNRRDQHDRIEKEINANLADPQKWHVPNLICFSGNRDLLDDVTGANVTAEGLSRVAPAAEAVGVNLVLELLNSKVDHPDYQADHTEWGVRVCPGSRITARQTPV
jgi:hydroxypyruvate isomerase